MANPFFSGRIPQELNEHIKRHCTETGESKTQLLINALSSYLNHPIKPQVGTSISVNMFSQLEQRVAEIEKRMEITSIINSDNTINIEEQSDKNSDNKTDNNINTTIEPGIDLVNTDINGDNKLTENVISKDLGETDKAQTQTLTSKAEEQKDNRHIIPTNEVPYLPKLKGMDAKKITNKLRNSKRIEESEVKIGQYIFKYYDKEPGAKGALLWEVITSDNSL